MANEKLREAQRGYAEAAGRTGDPILDKISDWCDEHGWDEIDSPSFLAWLKAKGVDRDSLMIAKCRMPEGF